jgi:hypothetical protein
MKSGLALLLLFSAVSARAGFGDDLPDVAGNPRKQDGILVPPLTLRLDNEDADVAMHLHFKPAKGLEIGTLTHAGALAPFGDLGTPLNTLNASPYGTVGVQANYSGPVEAYAVGTLGFTNVFTHKGIYDPKGDGASPASSLPTADHLHQDWITYSGYADLGKIVQVGRNAKAAFFAAVGSWGITTTSVTPSDTYYTVGLTELNTGTMWMIRRGKNEVSLAGDLQLQIAPVNMYNNDRYTAVPSGLVSAEYARDLGGARASAGAEATASRADLAVRPYLALEAERVAAIVAGNFRDSRDPFFPTVTGVGAELRAIPTPGVILSVSGSMNHEQYALAPSAQNVYTVMANATVEDSKIFRATTGYRSHVEPPVAQDIPLRTKTLNALVPSSGYADTWNQTFTQADSRDKFIAMIPVHNMNDILAALSIFTSSFSAKNYNYTEGSPENLNNDEQIYEKARESFLTGNAIPILVCIGSSQYTANLARDLGKKLGINIAASAITVEVPDSNGAMAGHAVAAVVTPQYGIVFVDWGKLTPTGTWDTKTALAIYQALVGIPAIYHEISGGEEGHLVGYVYSDEGKAFLRAETFFAEMPTGPLPRVFDDDPKTHELTLERYRRLLRK